MKIDHFQVCRSMGHELDCMMDSCGCCDDWDECKKQVEKIQEKSKEVCKFCTERLN